MTEPPRSLLVFRNGSIGNTLVAIPALRSLHRQFPGARLHVVVDPIGAELLRHCPWIDGLITYDKRGVDRGLAGWWHLVRRLRATRPTHAILLKRFFRNGLLARFSGAPHRLGFSTDGRAPFLNATIPYDLETNVARLNLRLVALLGAPADDEKPEIWLSQEDRQHAGSWMASGGTEERAAVVAHYGGLSTPPDFIPRSAFATLVHRCAAPDRPVILLAAGPRERQWAEELRVRLPGARVAADLPIRTVAALLERSEQFLGFNSGPAHLAATVGTPSRILFRPGTGAAREIARWLPLHPLARPMVPPETGNEAALMAWSSAVPIDAAMNLRAEQVVG